MSTKFTIDADLAGLMIETMPRYQISGIDAQGQQVNKTLQAANKSDASEKALEQEILVQSIRPVDRSRYKINLVEKLNFIRLLSVTSQSGLPVLSGLQTIMRESKKGGLNRLTVEIASDLESGSSISEAMASREGVFDDLAISLVKAGELSGRLSQTLAQLYDYESNAYNFRKKLRSALAYPAIVFVFSIVVVASFLLFIVPRFRQTYSSFSEKLPPVTEILLGISDFLNDHFMWILAALAIVTGLVIAALRSPRYRVNLEEFFLKVPVFGEIFFWGILVRFSRTLGTLLENQVNFLDALYLAIDASGSFWFQNRMQNVPNNVKEGVAFSEALHRPNIFPELALQMISMGEESGRMAPLLNDMASFYSTNMEHRVATIESVIQPIVVIALGIFILFLVVALFLPMFDLPGVIK